MVNVRGAGRGRGSGRSNVAVDISVRPRTGVVIRRRGCRVRKMVTVRVWERKG